jgi:hypothetical protein
MVIFCASIATAACTIQACSKHHGVVANMQPEQAAAPEHQGYAMLGSCLTAPHGTCIVQHLLSTLHSSLGMHLYMMQCDAAKYLRTLHSPAEQGASSYQM